MLAVLVIGAKNYERNADVRLLNVSYDPTRELYQKLDPRFIEKYQKETGRYALVTQSHGGSSRQGRSVIAGEQVADVVTLGLRSDVEALHKRGLIADAWWTRLPNNSQPYYSTIVFVVRRGNPFGIADWPDLVRGSTEVITNDPKTSGNGKLSVLAAWGAIVLRGGSEADARAYLKSFFDHTPFLEAGARSARHGLRDREARRRAGHLGKRSAFFAAQRFAGGPDRRSHLFAAEHRLRAHRGCRSAVWSVHGHRIYRDRRDRRDRRDPRILVAARQWPTGAVSLVVFSALSFIDPDARLDAYEAMFLLTAMIGIFQIAIAVLSSGI